MLTQRREIRITSLNPPVNHYTDAVQFGNLLFISGQIAAYHQNTTV